MTRYFYDTEFLEDGRTIELISIGIVADDGRELYAVAEEIESDAALYQNIRNHQWLMDNVVPHLPLKPGSGIKPAGFGEKYTFTLDDNSNVIMPRRMIRNAVRDFLLANDGEVELWADYCAYDHVVLCQLFGRMIDLPHGLPMYTNDIQQAWRMHGRAPMRAQDGTEHNALEDARYVQACFEALAEREEMGALGRITG